MRAILVGSPRERERFIAELSGTSIEVVGEFATLADARASAVDADGIILAARSPRLGPARTTDPLDDGDGPVEALTPREMDVLTLLAEGLPNKAIADALGISDQTVKFHVSSISGKLGAKNRTDAVRRAARRGLITL